MTLKSVDQVTRYKVINNGVEYVRTVDKYIEWTMIDEGEVFSVDYTTQINLEESFKKLLE